MGEEADARQRGSAEVQKRGSAAARKRAMPVWQSEGGRMRDPDKIVICLQCGDADEASALSARTGLPLREEPGEELTVLFDKDGVSLCGYGLSYLCDLSQMQRRISGGRLMHEMLVHLSKTAKPRPRAVDATAGLGEDSLLLAAYGYEVTLFERDPIVACLLRDALRRAGKIPELAEAVGRMTLIEGDSTVGMASLPEVPDLVYLDPMFPERQKSGLIGKKLQLLQKLEQPCVEESALLDAAIATGCEKIVIKRPLKGPFLAGRKPSYSIKGKAIRYDCLAFPK